MLSPDSRYLYAVGDDETVGIINTTDAHFRDDVIGTVIEAGTDPTAVAITPDGAHRRHKHQ